MTTAEIWRRFREMGVLRNLLHALALAFIAMLPFSEPSRVMAGWQLVTGGIIPATTPLVFIVMMFDVMMANVLKGEAEPEHAIVLRRAIRTNLTLGLILIGLWILSFEDVLLR
ncbi:MAG: hypothetical protein U5O39_03820 [Gammaproteobacteria bacterium]|nr:hypothetical protein [Gammaproteobacteria bacterium]